MKKIVGYINTRKKILYVSIVICILSFLSIHIKRYTLMQGILGAIYFTFLYIYYRKEDKAEHLKIVLFYLLGLGVVNFVSASPYLGLPNNLFFSVINGIGYFLLYIYKAPIEYLWGRRNYMITPTVAILLSIYFVLYLKKYCYLINAKKKYVVLCVTGVVTYIEMVIAYCSQEFVFQYNHIPFAIITYFVWLFCIYYYRDNKVISKKILEFWSILLLVQGITYIVTSCLEIPKQIERFLFEIGFYHIGLYSYMPFSCSNVINITPKESALSLWLVFTLAVVAFYFYKRKERG